DGRRRMGEASDLLPAVLQEVAARSDAPGAAGWVLHSAHVSGTQVVVLKVGPPGGPATAVVKMPATAEGVASQRREADVLAALGAEESLGDLAGLVPGSWPRLSGTGRRWTGWRRGCGGPSRAAASTWRGCTGTSGRATSSSIPERSRSPGSSTGSGRAPASCRPTTCSTC